jgi:hypothetical protein
MLLDRYTNMESNISKAWPYVLPRNRRDLIEYFSVLGIHMLQSQIHWLKNNHSADILQNNKSWFLR